MIQYTYTTFRQIARLAFSAIFCVTAANLSVAATTLQLDFTVPSSFNESNRQAVLQWNAEPGKTYLIQSADDLGATNGWKDVDLAAQNFGGPLRWMAPEALSQEKYYRLVLPQPTVHSVAPALVDSSNPTALLYVSGQCLPTNGSVVINGQNYTPTSVDPNGSWVAISLNGLPPGTPVIGTILVLDSGSNVVTTLPVQSPVLYGTEMTAEQLQGPPDEPPASPSSRHRGHVTVLKAMDVDSDGQADRAVDYRGHVTVLKSHDAGTGSAAGTRVRKGMQDLKSLHRGHVTVLKSHYDGDSEGTGGGEFSAGKKGLNAVNVKLAYSSGELQCDETDLVIPGRGLDFVWARSYRSRTGPTTAQGAGWDFSYNVALSLQPDGTAQLRSGNGRTDTFYADGTNGWVRNEYFVVVGDLDGDGTPERVTFPDTGKWLFHPPGTAAAGKLAQIVDRNGNTIILNYNVAGRLDHIVDDLGRTNTVAYNPAGQIASVTDFSGRTVSYEYNGNGDLTACVSPAVTGTPNGNDFPGGKTNRYAYSSGFVDARLNHNLINCTDANGQTWLQVAYQTTNNPAAVDFDAVDYVLRGIDKKDIRRGMVVAKPGSPPRLRAIVNDGVGNVCEAYYDSHHRLVELQEYTGRANPSLPTTETDNRPTGKLRIDDPDLYVTKFEWNADSLCTKIISPRGNVTEMVYQRAFNQNSSRSNNAKAAAHRGDLRLRREVACCDQDDDGDGLVDTLVSTFEYDPRFGSSPTTSSGKVSCNYVRRDKTYHRGSLGGLGKETCGGNTFYVPSSVWAAEDIPTSSDADQNDVAVRYNGRCVIPGSGMVVFEDLWPHSGDLDFCVSATDPRGIVTTAQYDAQGNCTKSIKQGHYAVSNFKSEIDGQYNSSGQLTAITNAADGTGYRRVDTISYHSSGPQAGYVQSIAIDEPGVRLTTSYEYDARGNLTRCVDANTNDWLFTYNQLDQCVRRQTPNSSFGTLVRYATQFHYDANDNLVRVDEDNRDADGNPGTNAVWRTQFVYDALNRMVGCWRDKNGNLVLRCDEVQYDANDNVTLYRSGEAVNGNDTNAVVQFLYDERDLLFCRINAPGTAFAGNEDFTYDQNGNMARIQQTADTAPAKLDTCIFSYDGINRLVSVTDAMSNVVSYAYDRNGNVSSARVDAESNDGPGSTGNLRYHYREWKRDSLDRCVSSTAAFFDPATQTPIGDGSSVSSCTYAPNGQLLTSTDDNGHTTSYTYDTVGRLASVRDAKNNLTSYTYDGCGNLLSATQTDRSDLGGAPQQFRVVHTYDKLHRLMRSVDNVGNTNLYAYDSRDNLVRTTDPKGNDTCYFYDGLARCVDTISYVGPCDASPAGITINTSHVEYDDNDRVTASTDSNGNTTLYAYDSQDRCVLVTEADGTSSSLVWSPRSNLIKKEHANGTVTTNVYDLLDRCVMRQITPGPTVASSTTFETFAYDGLSRCVAATNDVSASTFAYDSLGNCVRQTQDGLTSTSTYDGVGNCLSMTYPGGRVVTYTYDALDHPTSLSSSAGAGLPATVLAQNAYDGPGRLARMSRANNVNTRYQWDGLVSPPNVSGDFGWMQVRGVNHQVAGGGAVVDQRIATFDRSQNRTLRAQIAPFVQGGTMLTNTLDYDALDRLRLAIKTKGTSAQRVDYSLDGNGNRLSVAVDLVAEPYIMDNTFPDPADFQMNQYTLTPSGMFQYDANGNRVSRATAVGELLYQYDYADRLVAVTDMTSGLPELVSTYAYDALGRRIAKTVFASGLPPTTTILVYDVGCVIEERDNGALKRTYAFPHVFDQKGRIMFTDLGETLYCHDDDLGNTLALTDATGAVVERFEYDDYGAVSFLTGDGQPNATGTSSKDYLYCWGGLRVDPETGLHNNDGGEYYDPQLGQKTHGKWKTFRGGGVTAFAANNPWSSGGGNGNLSKEEGGRHTPFHNRLLGGALPGGAVISAAVSSVGNLAGGGGGAAAASYAATGRSSSMPNRISMNVTVPKQTQGATFGEKVNQGLHAAGSALSQGSSGGAKMAQGGHNSSRSNKSSSIVLGGGDPSEIKVKFIVKM